jgi:hypothetical protein
MSDSRRFLVVGGLALAAIPAGHLVVEDEQGNRVADVIATVTAFPREGGVVFAGPKERRGHHMTVIVTPADDGTPYPVKEGGWMTPPLDLKPGQPVTMIAQDGQGRELFRVEARPDAEGKFPETFGPDWVSYVPVDE